MKITVLGTGTSQGVPVVACDCKVCSSKNPKDKRLRTAILVETSVNSIVIDAGPDFRQQMLRENVKKVNAVFITHNHKDHTGGLDDVRAFNWILKQPMEVFARQNVLKSIKKDFDYAFEEEKYPGVPQINLNTIENKPFSVNGEEILPIDALHAQLPVFGFRMGDFSYLTDANFLTDEELDKMKGSKYIIINALRKEKHYSHFNVEEAVDLLQYLKPEKGFLTHISHQMGLHEEINKELPPGIELAYDGLKLII